ncbi:MAG: hypothetical protein WC080_02100 [Patescibacteria group bacterium]|jgi:hypothetical protein
MSGNLTNYTDEDLENLEDELFEEAEKEREEDMPVSGKSVFEIQRVQRKREEEHKDDKKEE